MSKLSLSAKSRLKGILTVSDERGPLHLAIVTKAFPSTRHLKADPPVRKGEPIKWFSSPPCHTTSHTEGTNVKRSPRSTNAQHRESLAYIRGRTLKKELCCHTIAFSKVVNCRSGEVRWLDSSQHASIGIWCKEQFVRCWRKIRCPRKPTTLPSMFFRVVVTNLQFALSTSSSSRFGIGTTE
jgi:hypothetical protein